MRTHTPPTHTKTKLPQGFLSQLYSQSSADLLLELKLSEEPSFMPKTLLLSIELDICGSFWNFFPLEAVACFLFRKEFAVIG